MNQPIQFLIELLFQKIKLNDKVVPLIKRPYPVDKTPCITLDNQNVTLMEKWFSYEPLEYLNRVYDSTVAINVWCDNENDRTSIIEQIQTCFNRLETDHYTYCGNFKEGKCLHLDKSCPAIMDTDGRSFKHQCPKPEEYSYTNLFKRHRIYRESFHSNEGIDLDEYNQKPPLLRTMINTNMRYLNKYCNDGKISETLEYEE